jgi:hypothetical protein
MVRLPNLRRPVSLGVVLALAVLTGAGGFAARQAANAAEPLEGKALSGSDVRILTSAGAACTALTPARLAGQVMAASQFGSQPVPEMRDGGATGVAALTPAQFQQHAPSADARPTDRKAAITALAHLMCQLAGQARGLKLEGGPWKIALAAFRRGMDKVIAAGGVPADAEDYVEIVDRYALWYALQPALGGGAAAPAARISAPPAATAIPVPPEYVGAIAGAGKLCKEMPPARIAAQIMVTSGFDPGKLGPAGEQGIAQFLPKVWTATVRSAATQSPWDSSAAIPALGRTMCRLLTDAGGQYAPALAAFTRGDQRAQVGTLADAVAKAEQVYAKDTRLQAPAAPKSSAPPASPKPDRTKVAGKPKAPVRKTPKRDNQPPVKAAAGTSDRTFGPYFILNLTTKMCVDLPAEGAGLRDGPVNQYPCFKTGEDNQEWIFEPRAADSDGNQLYWIRNADDGFCVDPPGTGAVASGTELNETGCFDQDNQYFRLEPKKSSGGFQYYWLRNTATDMCLDVPGAGDGGAEARLDLVPCMANDDHEWALVEKAEW